MDYERCRIVSGCADVMIGRGAVADPFLARRIKSGGVTDGTASHSDRHGDWLELAPFWSANSASGPLARRDGPCAGRLKLWLNALRTTFVEAEALYWAVRAERHR